MLCGSGVLPLHMAAGQGTPLKLAAATCGRLLRSVSCSSGGAAASTARQSGSGPSSALSWQPARWRSISSRAGTSGVFYQALIIACQQTLATAAQLQDRSAYLTLIGLPPCNN